MKWWRNPGEHARLRAEHGSSSKAALAQGDISPRNAQAWWVKLVAAGCVDSSGVVTGVEYALPSERDHQPRDERKVRVDPDGLHLGEQTNIGKVAATLTTAANPRGTDLRTPEDILRDKGLDPAEWDYTWSATEWDALAGDGKVTTLHRVKISAMRRPEAYFAFEMPLGWSPAPAATPVREHGKPELIPILSDPHAPNTQGEVIEAFLAWCEEHQPGQVWCLGDAANNSPFGRHGVNRRLDVDASAAVWSTTELLIRIAMATPGAKRTLLFGNHDYWLERLVLNLFPQLAKMTRHGEDKPYLAISNVLKLDEIGWGYHYTEGEYHDVAVELVPGLMAMHGTRTGKHGGALKEIEKWEGVSIIQGHDHTLGMTAVRYRKPGGQSEQRYGISAGSAANCDLGYDPAHNVGQGWPVLALWPDGRWHVDFAQYDPATRSVTWRDWRYDAA